MSRIWSVAVLAVSCGGNVASVPVPVMPPIFDHTIVFGQRVGPVSLRMTEEQLHSVIAEPVHGMPYSATRTGYLYGKLRMSLVVERGVVVQVSPSDGSYRTASGVRVGGPLDAAIAATASKREYHGVASYCFPDHTFVTARTGEKAATSPDCAVGTICDVVVGGCVP